MDRSAPGLAVALRPAAAAVVAACVVFALRKRSGGRKDHRSMAAGESRPPVGAEGVAYHEMCAESPGSGPAAVNEQLLDGVTIETVRLLQVPHMNEYAGPGKMLVNSHRLTSEALREHVTYRNLKDESDYILAHIVRRVEQSPESVAYVRAGPRAHIYWDPSEVRAAIVTCGGLCPGINNIVRELVNALHKLYGVHTVLGVRNGYQGMAPEEEPVLLTPASVQGIHHKGGTVLGTSRGGFNCRRILSWLHRHGVNQLYIIGGDGTHRGAQKLYAAARDQDLRLSVAGIPKTIDNDIDLVDRSFGFNTAVEEAQAAIRSAKVEATCAPNGVGIVKLMGRHAGFIAAHAALASQDVDLCLIPEVPIQLEGQRGCLPHLERVLHAQGHAVVVVAEGAGEELLREECADGACDASGNRALPPIGPFIQSRITHYFKARGMETTIKYIDPSYMIRSVPPSASDSLFCLLLAQNAVHGVMAGFTGFVTALCNNRVVYLPINAVVLRSPRCMDPFGRTWERILSTTGQPDTADLLPGGEEGRRKLAHTKSFSAKTVF